RAVGPAIDEVPDEDDGPLGGAAVGVASEAGQEAAQGVHLAVDVADDVEGAFGEGADQAWHAPWLARCPPSCRRAMLRAEARMDEARALRRLEADGLEPLGSIEL